jgi:hypothetical protein
MKTKHPRLLASMIALSLLVGCKKESFTEQSSSQSTSLSQTSTAIATALAENQVCGQYVQFNMVDYYPNAYYGTYANVNIGNDADNVYIVLNSLNGFDFTKLKVVIGDLTHLQTILGPYTDPPTAQVGPANPDYSQTFASPGVATYTFTIPRSSLNSDCFYVYAWAFGEKWANGNLSDWRSSWLSSTTKINSDVATSYVQYCLQNCQPQDCGQLRTQTPGGWGAEPNGNNPGTYLHQNFAAAFPSGLTVGSTYTVHFTTAQAITNYLPAGGQAKKLTQSYNNPATIQLKNTLVDHLVALTLSVRFDETDASFGQAGTQLGDMVIGSGAFATKTVKFFLGEANKVLGGGASSYSVQDVVTTASAINENYVDGKINNDYLVCPNQ